MSVEKNHEQYLEQIEIAVAETTKELMSKHNGDLRAMAKVCAEKQVEINRLKEYQSSDRKTIRNLKKQLKEAVDEIECIHSTLESKEGEYECEIAELKEQLQSSTIAEARSARDKALAEIVELKKEIELQKDYIDALPESLKEKEYYLEQAYLDLNATEQGMDRIKKENEKLKEEIRRNDHQACAHLREIAELKEENKKLKEEEIEKVFGVSEEVFEKLMKECPPDPDDYKEYKDELHAVKNENKGLRNGGGDYISREEHQKVCDILNDEAEFYKVKFMKATGKLK